MSYREKDTDSHVNSTAKTFEEKLRVQCDKMIQWGRDGLKPYAKTSDSTDLVYLNHVMHDDVFDLGVKLHNRFPSLDYKTWASWMMNAELRVGREHVSIYHRSEFFCQYAERKLGGLLQQYFDCPVHFLASQAINDRVAA